MDAHLLAGAEMIRLPRVSVEMCGWLSYMTPDFCIPRSQEVASKRQGGGGVEVYSYLSSRQQPQLLPKCTAPVEKEEFSMYSRLADSTHSSLKAVTWSVGWKSPASHCCPQVMLRASQTGYYEAKCGLPLLNKLEENSEVK